MKRKALIKALSTIPTSRDITQINITPSSQETMNIISKSATRTYQDFFRKKDGNTNEFWGHSWKTN